MSDVSAACDPDLVEKTEKIVGVIGDGTVIFRVKADGKQRPRTGQVKDQGRDVFGQPFDDRVPRALIRAEAVRENHQSAAAADQPGLVPGSQWAIEIK